MGHAQGLDRRQFLQTSVAAALASVTGPSLAATDAPSTALNPPGAPPSSPIPPASASPVMSYDLPQASFGRARIGRIRPLAMVPMRDGVRLATTVFLPEQPGRYPTIMIRTPYNRQGQLAGWDDWARNGFAFIVQDCRGRFDSEGTFVPFVQETNDTPDMIAWIRQQDWSDGRVGTAGPSYMNWSQTLGTVKGNGQVADALVPTFAPFSPFQNRGFVSYGALSFFLTFWWYALDTHAKVGNGGFKAMFDIEEVHKRLPLETLDESISGFRSQLWRERLNYAEPDPTSQAMHLLDDMHKFTMPTMQIAGWYDYYPAQQLEAWNLMRQHAKTPEIAANHKIVIGPWGHNHGFDPAHDPQIIADFGPTGIFWPHPYYRAWFNKIFKNTPASNGFGEAPVRIFVMGQNQWRDENEWPLARTKFTNYFLNSLGRANTRNGDGKLQLNPPAADARPDHYDYDPDNPMMTRGGNHSIGPWEDWYKKYIWCGPTDQGPNEDRADMLVYSSDILERDLEVTGPVTLHLWAATSAPDTDWIGRLIDVHPDGKAINLCEGNLRARFRDGDRLNPKLVTPGEPIEYTLNLQVTSNVFKAGHRIRLDITSSNFPLLDRNLNTGEHPYKSANKAIAHQTIFHDTSRPSRLILPIIPA